MIGVSAKAFMHIRLFSVPSGRESGTPFGIETLVHLYEPWLLRTILIDEALADRKYLEKKAGIYHDLDEVKNRVKSAIPKTLPEDERTTLSHDVELADLKGAMDVFLLRIRREDVRNGVPGSSAAEGQKVEKSNNLSQVVQLRLWGLPALGEICRRVALQDFVIEPGE